MDRDIKITELPEDILQGFKEPATETAAAELKTWDWVRAIRNAIAHSTVAYLNAGGTQTVNSAVTHIVFVSEDDLYKPTGHHLFVISRDGFREFIDRWMAWLGT